MADIPEDNKEKMKLKEEGMNEDHESKETPAEEAREEECKTCGKKGKECTCKKKAADEDKDETETEKSEDKVEAQEAQVTGTGREPSRVSMAGQSPSEVTYGKSVDLNKSALYVEMQKMNTALVDQFSLLEKNLHNRMEALSKSVADRQANMEKTMTAMETFYKKSFHKAIAEQAPIETPVVQKKFSL